MVRPAGPLPTTSGASAVAPSSAWSPTASSWAAGSLVWSEYVAGPAQAEAARAFYGELLGWSFSDLLLDGYRGYSLACDGPPSPDRQVAGFDGRGEQPGPARWQPLLATDDLQRATQTAVRLGGDVLIAPRDVLGGGGKVVLADPGGAMFGLWQLAGHPGPGRLGTAGSVAWAERSGADADAATAFYGRVAGVRYEALAGAGSPGYRAALTAAPPSDLAHHAVDDRGLAQAAWHTYFGVHDVHAAARRAVALGGELRGAPQRTAFGAVCQLRDPHGVAFGLIQRPR